MKKISAGILPYRFRNNTLNVAIRVRRVEFPGSQKTTFILALFEDSRGCVHFPRAVVRRMNPLVSRELIQAAKRTKMLSPPHEARIIPCSVTGCAFAYALCSQIAFDMKCTFVIWCSRRQMQQPLLRYSCLC